MIRAEVNEKPNGNSIMMATIVATVITLSAFLVPLMTKTLTLINCVYVTLGITIGAIVISGTASLCSKKALTFLGAFIVACGGIASIGLGMDDPWSGLFLLLMLACFMGGFWLTAFSEEDVLSLKLREAIYIMAEFMLVPMIIGIAWRCSSIF